MKVVIVTVLIVLVSKIVFAGSPVVTSDTVQFLELVGEGTQMTLSKSVSLEFSDKFKNDYDSGSLIYLYKSSSRLGQCEISLSLGKHQYDLLKEQGIISQINSIEINEPKFTVKSANYISSRLTLQHENPVFKGVEVVLTCGRRSLSKYNFQEYLGASLQGWEFVPKMQFIEIKDESWKWMHHYLTPTSLNKLKVDRPVNNPGDNPSDEQGKFPFNQVVGVHWMSVPGQGEGWFDKGVCTVNQLTPTLWLGARHCFRNSSTTVAGFGYKIKSYNRKTGEYYRVWVRELIGDCPVSGWCHRQTTLPLIKELVENPERKQVLYEAGLTEKSFIEAFYNRSFESYKKMNHPKHEWLMKKYKGHYPSDKMTPSVQAFGIVDSRLSFGSNFRDHFGYNFVAEDFVIIRSDPVPMNQTGFKLHDAGEPLPKKLRIAGYGSFHKGRDYYVSEPVCEIVQDFEEFFVTNCMQGPGFSGGPFFYEKDGEFFLVGINSAQIWQDENGRSHFGSVIHKIYSNQFVRDYLQQQGAL